VASKQSPFADLLMQGAREAAAHAAGDEQVLRRTRVTRRPVTARDVQLRRSEPPTAARIRAIRDRLELSQKVFADLLNVSAATVRAWEQGQRVPDGPSVRLLELAQHHPATLLDLATRPPARERRRSGSRPKARRAGVRSK
jgi:putative transcriptional regulator